MPIEQGSYPVYQLKGTSWVGSTIKHQPKCKCCAEDVAEELLELLTKRAANKPVKGVKLTLIGLQAYFAKSGRGFAKPSLINHMKHHVLVQRVTANGQPTVTKAAVAAAGKLATRANSAKAAERDLKLREAVDAAEAQVVEPADAAARGIHVGYLEKVVRVAAHVVEQFPERVTPEMGIRASAEIAKMRQNDSREALLDVLVSAHVASAGKVARVGELAIVRELDVGEETVTDAEVV